jgi:hypothetical protein
MDLIWTVSILVSFVFCIVCGGVFEVILEIRCLRWVGCHGCWGDVGRVVGRVVGCVVGCGVVRAVWCVPCGTCGVVPAVWCMLCGACCVVRAVWCGVVWCVVCGSVIW